jgi:hypothetical protein
MHSGDAKADHDGEDAEQPLDGQGHLDLG